jgi:hypothetical protein
MSLCCGGMPCVFLMGAQNVPTERGVAAMWCGFYPQDVSRFSAGQALRDKESKGFYLQNALCYSMVNVLRVWVLCVPAEHIVGRK